MAITTSPALLPFATVALASAVLLLGAYTLYKLRHVHLLLYAARDQARLDCAALFRQMEALQGLYIDLRLDKSLPGTRGWAASPDFLLELARHALTDRPNTIVECSSGTSTLVLARCMQLNGGGKVYSLEHEPHYARQTRWQLQRHGLSDWATVIDAPLRAQSFGTSPDGAAHVQPWYDVSGLPDVAIGMLVIDGPPQSTAAQARYPAGPMLFGRLVHGAAVFLDDAARADEQQCVQRWQHEFPELELNMLQCEKGCARLRRR